MPFAAVPTQRLLDAGDRVERADGGHEQLIPPLVEPPSAHRTRGHARMVDPDGCRCHDPFGQDQSHARPSRTGDERPTALVEPRYGTMNLTEIERRDAEEEILSWRFEQLLGVGYERRQARVLSRRLDVDLHHAVDLVRRGCSHELALLILL